METRLRELRHRLDLTQTELAAHLGKSLAAVQRWERDEQAGKPAPRMALLAAWALLRVKERGAQRS